MEIVLWFALALVVDRMQLVLAQRSRSYSSIYNGMGAIDSTVNRTADAPMAYRVLVPFWVSAAERIFPALKPHRLPVLYEPLKILSLAGLFVLSDYVLGRAETLLLAALLPMTFLYDYWDWLFEMMGFIAALSGRIELACIFGFLHSWARPETSLLVPVVYWFATVWEPVNTLFLTVVIGVGLLLVQIFAGRRELYCERFLLKANWQDIREIFENRPFYSSEIFMSLLLTGLAIGSIVYGIIRADFTVLIPAALLFTGWTMARAAETRVFASVLIWVVISLV